MPFDLSNVQGVQRAPDGILALDLCYVYRVQSDSDDDEWYIVAGGAQMQNYECSCPAFKFSGTNPRTCKHIQRVIANGV